MHLTRDSAISHESVYHYIYSDLDRRYLLHKNLRRKHRYRIKNGQKKPRIPKELLISSRPDVINKREEFGHWECDLMVFKKGVKTNLITLRERKSRYLIAITKIKDYVKSITFDQGSEFKKYEWIKNCIGTEIYFCEPASPHQKGSIENANGNIRIEFQRDYDAERLKQRHLNNVIKNINNRPMKCLNYLTPNEVFEKEMQL